MSDLKLELEQISKNFSEELEKTATVQELDSLRVAFIGKQGKVTSIFKNIKILSVEEKKEIVPQFNALKTTVEEQLKQAKQALIEKLAHAEQLKEKHFDVTAHKTDATSDACLKGHLHPYSQFIREVEDIFLSMGFELRDGPFVETDFYNFTALNIPEDHPARDMYDTFWLNQENLLLRTHTSTVQIRTMEEQRHRLEKGIPIASFAHGFTFRHEAVDATHDTMFMQCEGFVIDKNITISHLFATAQTFLKALFKTDELDIRIRPGFFPFVEPGAEIDMRCPFCEGGCSVCKKTTWVEVFPGGLIHPNVLRAGGIDPEKYSGFAFGFGLTRLAMLKYKINDIRLLLGGKLKFLEQF